MVTSEPTQEQEFSAEDRLAWFRGRVKNVGSAAAAARTDDRMQPSLRPVVNCHGVADFRLYMMCIN